MPGRSGLSRLNGFILSFLVTFVKKENNATFYLLQQAKYSIVKMKYKIKAWNDENKCLAASAWFSWHSYIWLETTLIYFNVKLKMSRILLLSIIC